MKETWIYRSLQGIADAFSVKFVKVVSFDLFDTLVRRPVARYEDVFEMLDRDFSAYFDAFISFRKLREEAEAVLRRRVLRGEMGREDFTLQEIYDELRIEFGLDQELADRMMNAEIELECRLCETRQSGKWLWEQAVKAKKRILVISDMTLPAEVLQRILTENGYGNPEKLYTSSDTGKRKLTGHLFDLVTEELNIKPEEIFHIGDNLESDCRMAAKNGLQCAWLPNTLQRFELYGCGHQAEKNCRDLIDWEAAKRSVGISAARKMAANMYFDDPFRPFDIDSDYNGDPYFVGYAALGPELLAVIRWIASGMESDRSDRILFMARDGYLPLKAWELFRQKNPELPPAGYLRVSRIAVLPALIRKVQDLYELPVDIQYQTPKKLLLLLNFCDRFPGESYGSQEIKDDESMSRDAFQKFITWFIKERYDSEKHKAAIQRIRNYLLDQNRFALTEHTVLFDMGYSGRIPAALLWILEMKMPVYYFHADATEHFHAVRRSGMKLRTFFDFNPQMESTLREYAYLEPGPSCIGYQEDGTEIYDIGPAEGYRQNAETMQSGALDFIRDFLKSFSGYEKETMFRNHDASMPFEAFLRHCSTSDRRIFEGILIDDELWGGRRDIDLRYLMETRLKKLPDYVRNER